jgi:hypothetical protein
MAVKELTTITTYNDMVDYVTAEHKEAVKYCSDSTTVGLYKTALDLARDYEGKGLYGDATGIAAITDAIYAARAAWKSAGCSKSAVSSGKKTGDTTTNPPGDDKEDGVTGASMWGPLLLAGLGLLGIWYFTSKKGKGGRKGTRRETTHAKRLRRYVRKARR